MAHLWIEEGGGAWAVAALEGGDFALGGPEDAPVRRVDPEKAFDGEVMLHRRRDGVAWVLLSPPQTEVRVNGTRIAGLRRLAHRDEICTPRRRFYFSTERLPREVAFPGSDRPIPCARCRAPMIEGLTAVVCPECNLWHHEHRAQGKHRERLCWSYGPTAACCDFPTATSATGEPAFRWTPHGL